MNIEEKVEALERLVTDMYNGQVRAAARLIVMEGAFTRLAAQLANAETNSDTVFEAFVASVEAEFQDFRSTPEGSSPEVFNAVGEAVEVLLQKMRKAYRPQ